MMWHPNCYAVDRANIRQRKTGRPVRFELTEVTRRALDDYLRMTGRKPGEYLFPGRHGPDRPLTTRQYARLVSEWVRGIGLDPLKFATHSMRRTKVTLIYGSKAPFAILVSRSTTRWKSRRKSTSEIPGQSCRALPTSPSGQKSARSGLMHRSKGTEQSSGLLDHLVGAL